MAVSGIKDSLKERGVRLTRQRKILLDLIDQSGQHLDAERLFQLARQRDPKINQVTVYRTLKLLNAGGLVDELHLMHHHGDQHYYETRLKQEHAQREQIESHFGFKISHCQVLREKEITALSHASPGGHA